mmetsp:Transcript_10429/g.23708  ORF Transcript_10429/g.23708 Transcript_10429/m.23708 type:complete len:82 (+) Transcript_10429:42-287(+)
MCHHRRSRSNGSTASSNRNTRCGPQFEKKKQKQARDSHHRPGQLTTSGALFVNHRSGSNSLDDTAGTPPFTGANERKSPNW